MAAVGKFPTFFICWSDSRDHSWALAWLGEGGQVRVVGREGAPPRVEPRDAERPGAQQKQLLFTVTSQDSGIDHDM